MPPDSHAEIKRLLEENIALAKENNELLKKVHRAGLIGLFVRLLWFAVLIGVPFVVYFYLLEPYMELLRGIYEQLPEGHFIKLLFEAGL